MTRNAFTHQLPEATSRVTGRPYCVGMKESIAASTILVPLDGSPLSERALPYAERMAEATSADLVLIRVLPANLFQPAEDDPALAEEAHRYLAIHGDQIRTRGVQVKTVCVWGNPAAMILDQVQSKRANLIVMATHGRSGPGRWVYGSVADEVLRRAPVPVIEVPPAVTQPWPAERALRILVPLDGSGPSEAGLVAAEDVASPLGAELILLQVVQCPQYALYGATSAYLEAFNPNDAIKDAQKYLGTLARQRSVAQVRVVTELGEPSVAIAEVACGEKVDMIAMATHGRSGLARVVLGSVATGTLYRAQVPVMLVRPAAVAAQTAPEEHAALAR